MGGQLSARPYSTAPTKNAMANLANDGKVIHRCKTRGEFFITTRRAATVFEKWNFLIESYLP